MINRICLFYLERDVFDYICIIKYIKLWMNNLKI